MPGKTCGQPHNSPVTEQSYQAYVARRDECGPQGCGVLQLTWPATQDIATREGGCWRPEVNMRVGLRQFVSHLTVEGVQPAYSRYNTGKPGPSAYADRALALLPGWHKVIDGQ